MFFFPTVAGFDYIFVGNAFISDVGTFEAGQVHLLHSTDIHSHDCILFLFSFFTPVDFMIDAVQKWFRKLLACCWKLFLKLQQYVYFFQSYLCALD